MYSTTETFLLITGVSASKEMLCYEKFENGGISLKNILETKQKEYYNDKTNKKPRIVFPDKKPA
jgi:hypothetical protein